jgi:hypothetical protein
MATTGMLTGNALTVKLWSKMGFVDMYKNTAFGRMARRGTIMRAEELDRAEAGDDVTFNFTGILTGTGIGEGGTLVGNEEALDLQSFSMQYNVFRHAVASPNDDTIEQARTLVRFEDRARRQLPAFHASRLDASCFNQLAGVNSTTITVDGTVYSGTDRTFVQGLNTINAPTTNRIIRAAGAASDEALTSADTMTLDLIDAAVEQLQRTYPYAGALDGQEFDLYISYEQSVDLKRDTSGKIQWYTNYLSAMEGGMQGENPIFTGDKYGTQPIGKYANVNIIPTFRVATGENSSTSAAITTVRRAVLCGRNALSFASRFGGELADAKADEEGNVPFKFSTQLKDYDYIRGIEARMIYGVKKIQFDGEDYGSTVISTYAAAHTS